jgi:hypothetical protein
MLIREKFQMAVLYGKSVADSIKREGTRCLQSVFGRSQKKLIKAAEELAKKNFL